ncbi:MAG TPA: glycosyltransferase family 4 protein, partial [Candidatus Thermoplasmatota archaeon]
FVGPLSKTYRWKGVDTLMQAFRLVRGSIPNATLTLAGQGDRFDAFARLARDDGSLRLTGRLSDEQLVGEYQRASVVVLPSTSDAEAFGMVLAEANACGRAVVGSRIGGIPDFVTHGENGLLAIPGDPVDLARHVITLLRDKELARQMGNAGHEKVVRDHHWGTLSLQTEQILDAAAQGRVNLLRRSVDAQASLERRTAVV